MPAPPAAKLPRALTLPSGARLELVRKGAPAAPRTRSPGAPLFSEVLSLFDDGELTVTKQGAPLDVRDLPLADFHVLRAVLTKHGLVAEDEVEVLCHNCGAKLRLHPCQELEIGPYVDGELGDPELDVTPKLDEPLDIPAIALGRVREARSVTFEPRTVRQAAPLFEAMGRDAPFDVTPEIVRAMGVAALGTVRDAAKVARALSECDDDDFAAVTDAFLDVHYPLRLGAVVFCPECKARNDVDAPYERELGRSAAPARSEAEGEDAPHELPSALPPFDDFAERARALAEPMLAEVPGDPVELIVEGGVAAVDDGGEPLLGSYEPPPPRDAPVPQRPPTITVYYRTFEAIERDEGRFDWEGELRDTIEHELEHHVYFLRGDDPMDAAERAEIDDEALRVVGRREAERRALKGFGESVREFFVRAWPLVLLAVLALAIALATQR